MLQNNIIPNISSRAFVLSSDTDAQPPCLHTLFEIISIAEKQQLPTRDLQSDFTPLAAQIDTLKQIPKTEWILWLRAAKLKVPCYTKFILPVFYNTNMSLTCQSTPDELCLLHFFETVY